MKLFRLQSVALVAIAFILGCSEFIIVGILDDLANQFHVGLDQVGYLVTAFALIYAISTPFITLTIGKKSLFKILMLLLTIFIFGNILTAFANSFFMLALSRIITAIVSGACISIALAYAGFIAPVAKRAWLVSWVFSGFSIASVFGVPLGTWISTSFGWRESFYMIILLSLAIFALCAWVLPKDIRQKSSSHLEEQLTIFKDSRVWVGMFLPMFNLAGVYVFYTYLRPVLARLLGLSDQWLTPVLFLYGLMSLFSNQMSGHLAARSGLNKMPDSYIGQFFLLLLFPLVSRVHFLGLAFIMLIGLSMYLLNSPIQIHFLKIAETDYPQSLVLASSLTSIFANFGIALGSGSGGLVEHNIGLQAVGPVGALYVLVALGLTLSLNHLNGEASKETLATKKA